MEVLKDTEMEMDEGSIEDKSNDQIDDTPEENRKRKREEDGEKEKEGGDAGEPTGAKSVKQKVNFTDTCTITLGDQAENHAGMQKLGAFADEGFELEDLQKAKAWFEERGVKVSIHHLNPTLAAAVVDNK